MACKDCIHFEVCGFTSIICKTMEKDCKQFKNKADFVEVVMCKDCKCYDEDFENCHGNHKCSRYNSAMFPTDFCSYGERKSE